MILEDAKRTTAKVRIAPGIREIIDGQVSLSKIRDVEIADLLGREAVNLNVREVIDTIEGKSVLVTGGGGSIGSELCRQIARFNPKRLIVMDIYENSSYELQQELNNDYGARLNLDVVIASVTDREAVFSLIDNQKPDVIFHAAAHKHVPLMERMPNEAIKNNVFGTKNVAEAAHKFGVGRFVMISTDKAVNPTNIMGASKRVCEMYIQRWTNRVKQNSQRYALGMF
jgi:FlaA1/EpsC-like NDP-sugar epimerase